MLDEIADLLDILGSYERLISVIRGELEDIRDTYGDERRTKIMASQQDLSDEDLITEEELVVTISHQVMQRPNLWTPIRRSGGWPRKPSTR